MSEEQRVSLRLGESAVQVRTRDAGVAEAARAMFPEYISAASEDHRSSPSRVVSVEALDGGSYSISTPDPSGATWRHELYEWPGMVAALEHTLAKALLAGRGNALPVHAGGVEIDGGALLLLGPSGSGKSTLSVRLLMDGARLLGDDVVLVRPDGWAAPFMRRPKLDAAQAERFGIDPESTVLWHEGADECWCDPGQWTGWSQPAPVRVVARIRFVAEAALHAEALEPTALLAEIVGSVFDSELNPVATPTATPALIDLAEHCSGVRLTYGNAAEAAAELRRWMRPGVGRL